MIVVKYHEAAEDELLTEVGYLELRASGLGRRFLAEVGRAEDLIAQFPESAPEISPGIRKRVLRKFPYSLSIRLSGMSCSFLRWLTIAGGQVIGPAEPDIGTRSRHPTAGWARDTAGREESVPKAGVPS